MFLCSGVVFQQLQNLVQRLIWRFCSVVDLLFTVAPSLCGVVPYSLVVIPPLKEERDGCFTLIVFILSYVWPRSVPHPRGALMIVAFPGHTVKPV